MPDAWWYVIMNLPSILNEQVLDMAFWLMVAAAFKLLTYICLVDETMHLHLKGGQR